MDSERIRWGILGTGHIATVLTEDIQTLPDEAEVVAVGSRTQESADAFAARYGVPRAYGSYAELAADPEVDVIYVSTPHSDHLASSRLALEGGKAVLCEKPLTVSAAESRTLVDVARQQHRFLMEAVWMRTNPLIRQAAALVHSGELGAVKHVTAMFGFAFDGGEDHRLLNPELAGGGVLDLGVYPAHAVDVFLGEPADVLVAGNRGATGVDTNATALLVYPATEDTPAATATIHCTLETNVGIRLEVLCQQGRIVFDDFFIKPTEMLVYRNVADEPERMVTQLPAQGYTFQLQEVHRCLRAGELETPLVPWSSTLAVAGVLDRWMAGIP